MKPEHRKYILDNMTQKSADEIARELGLKERKVKRFIERAGEMSGGADENRAGVPGKKTYSRIAQTLVFFGIVLIAVTVRLIYLNQIKDNPFFVPFHHGLDDYLYDNWARAIAGGDIMGKEVFYGLPLYPYFLGFVYFLFGTDVFIARVAQVVLGALSCGFVYLIGSRVFSRTVGVVASLMLAFYAMAIYYEGFFVSASLAMFLNCLLVLVLLSVRNDSSALKWIAAGLLIGLSSLANASVLVFLPFVIIWALRSFPEAPGRRIVVSVVCMFAAVVLAILPVTVRNYAVGKDFVPVTAHSGITFYAGNNPLSNGSYKMPRSIGTSVIDSKENARVIAERISKRKLKPSEISKFWFDQSFRFIKDKPERFIRLVAKKMYLFWNTYEIPDVLPMGFFRRYSALLRMPMVNYAVLCPLALVGMFLCVKKRKRDIVLLELFILSVYVSTVIYFVNSRYRLMAVPFLAVFSAVTVSWFVDRIRKKDLSSLLTPSIAVLALAAILHVRMLEFRMEQSHNNLGIILKQRGRYDEAIVEYKKAIELNPDYDSPHYNLGLLYQASGDSIKAINSFKEAVRLNPDFIKARNKLGEAYMEAGQRDKALAQWRRSLELDPRQADVRALVDRY